MWCDFFYVSIVSLCNCWQWIVRGGSVCWWQFHFAGWKAWGPSSSSWWPCRWGYRRSSSQHRRRLGSSIEYSASHSLPPSYRRTTNVDELSTTVAFASRKTCCVSSECFVWSTTVKGYLLLSVTQHHLLLLSFFIWLSAVCMVFDLICLVTMHIIVWSDSSCLVSSSESKFTRSSSEWTRWTRTYAHVRETSLLDHLLNVDETWTL